MVFGTYQKKGNTYIRAREWVALIDGTVERLEGSGRNRVEARAALKRKIEKRKECIQYGMKKRSVWNEKKIMERLPWLKQ